MLFELIEEERCEESSMVVLAGFKRDLAWACHVVVGGLNEFVLIVDREMGGVWLNAVRKSDDEDEDGVGDDGE